MSATWRSFLRPRPSELSQEVHVRVTPMRRRHVRAVHRIERQVYPRPWPQSIFAAELAQPQRSRFYVVAHVGQQLVGYAGLMHNPDGSHVTNIAVDPAWQRLGVGARLLLTLATEARRSGASALTLEVRVSNRAAQALYQRFGFAPVGVRHRYYEDREDAIVMWAHDIDQPAYLERLRSIQDELPGSTEWDGFP